MKPLHFMASSARKSYNISDNNARRKVKGEGHRRRNVSAINSPAPMTG
jgi:hypothetical protein